MKKIILVGTFILSAISFANTATKSERLEKEKTKIETIKINKTKNSHESDWWITDRQIDRGSSRK